VQFVKAAIIGLGAMGRRHLIGCARVGIEVVRVVDPQIDRIAAQIGFGAGVELDVSVNRFLESPNADLVIVSTPTIGRCSIATSLVDGNVPLVLLEKPLGRSLVECRELYQASLKSKSRVAVNHPYRYMKQFQAVGEVVNSKEFGGLSSMHIVGGNGGLAMLMTHFVDFFELVTDDRIVEVQASFLDEIHPNPRGEHIQDYSGVVDAFTANGRRLRVDLGGSVDRPQGTGIVAIIAGPTGILQFDFLSGDIFSRIRGVEDINLPATAYTVGLRERLEVSVTDLVDASSQAMLSLAGNQDFCSIEQALHFVEVQIAAHVSHNVGGSSVDVNKLDSWSTTEFAWA